VKTIEPLAHQHGVAPFVTESPERLPYFEALQLLVDADFLVVPGSDDAQYTASKIYPYILARKPLVALFRETSSVCDVLRRTAAGTLVPLTSDRLADRSVCFAALVDMASRLPFEPATNWNEFKPYLAAEMTRQQCELFDDVLRQRLASTSVCTDSRAVALARDSHLGREWN